MLTANANNLTGFFGYQDPIVKKDDKKNADPAMEKLVIKAIEDPQSLTAQEFKKAQAYAKDKAVMQQDEQSIKKWIILNNFTIRQADNFQKMQRIVMFKNPELYEEGELARSGYAQSANTKQAAKEQNKIINALASQIVLFAFFGAEDADIKASQNRVLWYITQDYPDLTIIKIDTTINKELYQKLGEVITPSVWLAYKNQSGKPSWFRIYSGIATKNAILDQIQFVYQNIIVGQNAY